MAKIYCIIGVSGVGKTTLVQNLLAKNPDRYYMPISTTTRPMRENEVDGYDYHFVTKDEFAKLIENDELMEWAMYDGQLYGVNRKEFEYDLIILHVVEEQGAIKLCAKTDASIIAIVPPNKEAIIARLVARGGTEQSIKARLEADELRHDLILELANKVIVNDDLHVATKELSSLL